MSCFICWGKNELYVLVSLVLGNYERVVDIKYLLFYLMIIVINL